MSNYSVTYKAKDLKEVAAYFMEKAGSARQDAALSKPRAAEIRKAEAAVWEQAARMLESTVLTGEEDGDANQR